MSNLTETQHIVLEEIAYGYVYKKNGHGYIKQAPEGGQWEKASIAVKSLVMATQPLLALLTTEDDRIYLTSDGWSAFIDGGAYVPRGDALRLTKLADERVGFIQSMIEPE